MFSYIFYSVTHNNKFYISEPSNLLLIKIKSGDAFRGSRALSFHGYYLCLIRIHSSLHLLILLKTFFSVFPAVCLFYFEFNIINVINRLYIKFV